MRRPSPALVVAVIALIVAMSGTSYAVTQLPRNSVGSAQLKKNAVTAVKIKNNAVTGAKVKDGSLTGKDFAAGTLLQGPAGPKGDTGATGATGAQGPPGPSTSAAARRIELGTFDLTSNFQMVLWLGAGADAAISTTGRITVTEPSNLVVSADLAFFNNSGSSVEVSCKIEYSVGATDVWSSLDYSTVTFLTLPTATQSSMAPVGLQPVSAGTYDVRLSCRESMGSGNARHFYTTLTVTATGR